MKKDATPDMFSASTEKPKPLKEAPAIRQKGTYTASDMIGGMPTYLERISEAVSCLESRCDSAIRTKTLTPVQNKKLTDIAAEIRAILPELHRIRKDVDGMVVEVVHRKLGRTEPELI